MKGINWALNAMSLDLLHWRSNGWRTGESWSPAETPESPLWAGRPAWRTAMPQRLMQGITSARPATLAAVTSARPRSLWKVMDPMEAWFIEIIDYFIFSEAIYSSHFVWWKVTFLTAFWTARLLTVLFLSSFFLLRYDVYEIHLLLRLSPPWLLFRQRSQESSRRGCRPSQKAWQPFLHWGTQKCFCHRE